MTYTSMAMIDAVARGWNQERDYDGDGNTIPDGGTRRHLARDIYLPPGSAIYLPFDGTMVGWTTSNSGGDETMGLVASVRDDQGRLWRFIHLAVASAQRQLTAGTRVAAGTLLGHTTSRKYLGQRSLSHLHLDLFPAGTTDKNRRIDPIPVLGVTGFNRMVTGSSGLGPVLGIALGALAAYGVWHWYSSNRRLRA